LSDGKTAYERIRGKKCVRPVAEFGEYIHFRPLKGDPVRDNKLEPQWRDGVWLGVDARTDEVYVGTEEGVVRARDIRRRPADQRWSAEVLKKVKGVPWSPCGRKDTDIPVFVDTGVEGIARPEAETDELEQAARNLYVTRALLKRFGYTRGCRGCNALQYGTKQEVHSNDCRRRIAGKLSESQEGRQKVDEIGKRQKEREDRRQEHIARKRRKSCGDPVIEPSVIEPSTTRAAAEGPSSDFVRPNVTEGGSSSSGFVRPGVTEGGSSGSGLIRPEKRRAEEPVGQEVSKKPRSELVQNEKDEAARVGESSSNKRQRPEAESRQDEPARSKARMSALERRVCALINGEYYDDLSGQKLDGAHTLLSRALILAFDLAGSSCLLSASGLCLLFELLSPTRAASSFSFWTNSDLGFFDTSCPTGSSALRFSGLISPLPELPPSVTPGLTNPLLELPPSVTFGLTKSLLGPSAAALVVLGSMTLGSITGSPHDFRLFLAMCSCLLSSLSFCLFPISSTFCLPSCDSDNFPAILLLQSLLCTSCFVPY
jgi:hypothetical protein